MFRVSSKIFSLYLVVGIGTEIARSWPALIRSSRLFGPVGPFFQVIGGALSCATGNVALHKSVAALLARRRTRRT